MILATLTGLSLQTWAGVHDAGELGLLIGMVVSLFVPAKRSCPIR